MKKRDWLTPLSIPARKSGEYEIQHRIIPAGEKAMLNSTRNIFLGGQKGPSNIIYDKDTTWHSLVGPEGTWMTDLPVEQRQMEECLKGTRGKVLVGGLGLGLAIHLLAQKKAVKEIIVVEKSPDVIDLVRWTALSYMPVEKLTIIEADIFDYLKCCRSNAFSHAFYDIWQSDGEYTFFKVVCPLIELSKGKIKNQPVCWNADVMRGQLRMSLQSRLLFMQPEAVEKLKQEIKTPHPLWEKWPVEQEEYKNYDPIWHDWSQPFFRWWKDTQPSQDRAQHLAGLYANIYGQWDWQDVWHSLI